MPITRRLTIDGPTLAGEAWVRVDIGRPGPSTIAGAIATMSPSFPRITAAIFLGVGAVATALVAFALAVADIVIATGRFPARPGDAATAHSLASGTLPLGVFAVFGLIAAIALVLRTPRSKTLATVVATIGVVTGIATIGALMLASGPFATLPSTRVLDGIELIGAFTVVNLIALVAVLFDRQGTRAVDPAVAA